MNKLPGDMRDMEFLQYTRFDLNYDNHCPATAALIRNSKNCGQ